MKLRTSFFNTTVLKKDIFRFAPVWILYSIFLFMILPVIYYDDPAVVAADVMELMGAAVWINLFYGGLCAGILFGDLFNPRLSNALHAMPLRREGWFLTHMGAGFLFSFVPNALATGAMCFLLGPFSYFALLWLVIMSLLYLFFFGVGALSVMCTGKRLAMTAVYGIIIFFSMLVYVVADLFYEPLLFGIRFDIESFEKFCPIFLSSEKFVLYYYDKINGGVYEGLNRETWRYLYILAALGVLSLIGSVLIYRRRKLERAGDFLALRPLEPVFLIIYTLGMGVLLYGFSNLFGLPLHYGFILLGIIIGFFTGKMLLERTVKVFRLKTFLGFAVFAIVFFGSLLLTKQDPLGLTTYIPETEEVQFIRLCSIGDAMVYNDFEDAYQLETPEQIDTYRQIHDQLQSRRDHREEEEYFPIQIMYRLTDGSTVFRYYDVYTDFPMAEELRMYFSSPEYLLATADVDGYIAEIQSVDLYPFSDYFSYTGMQTSFTLTDREEINAFMQAFLADCREGTVAEPFPYHRYEESCMFVTLIPKTDVFTEPTYAPYLHRDITFYTGAKHTLAYVEELIQAKQS